MEFVLLGWPEDGPTLRLDYRRFAYAGKFVMSNTGKAVVRDDSASATPVRKSTPVQKSTNAPGPSDPESIDESVLAAVAFNADRTASAVYWLRYITVASDRRGEGLGPRLAAFVVDRAEDRGVRRFRIAVNNPFAYEAMYKAGFGYTGRQTGIAELVLERPGPRDRDRYQSGLDVYRNRDLGEPESSFLRDRTDEDPPEQVDWSFET